jgi:UDP:flavonoid glycosyltransferase YjiC (YdhE family)
MRFVLAAHPSVGHTQALRAIGRELLGRGHAVRFAITRPPRLPSLLPMPQPLRAAIDVFDGLAGDGFERIAMPMTLRGAYAAARVASSRGYDELDWAVELFTCDAFDVARRLAGALDGSEVVVADFAYFGAWLGAEQRGVPLVAVFHSGLPFPTEGKPPLGSGLDPGSDPSTWAWAERRVERLSRHVDRRIAQARRRLGLPPVRPRLFERPYSTTLNIITSFEAWELPRPTLRAEAAGPILWAGPCLGERAADRREFPFERLRADRPSVYISLGTVFNDRPRVYAALVEGVHRAGASAVVAAGASFEAVSRIAAPDDIVVRFAPQVALLPRMTAMIGHGGNNSTNEALRAGKPLVVVPFGGEQIANAQRVVGLGVGRKLDPADLSPERVAEAVRFALAADTRARAERLTHGLPEADGAIVAATALEALGLV